MNGVLQTLSRGLPLDPLPPPGRRDASLPHAPVRTHTLSVREKKRAVQNALRYFPPSLHEVLGPEFADELTRFGHIYMYRFLPQFPIRAYPLNELPAKCKQAAAMMLMILNNLDPRVAQFPHELVTYGGNGQVFSNWAQFWLAMQYLSQMTDKQTLVMYSGHPLGLFPSHRGAPRAVITNGMVIPNYSTKLHYDNMFALGVTMYGQMTAGSYCYIGPQGIVHGTTITVLNAGRKCIGVVAEVSEEALQKRHKQGWLQEVEKDLDKLISRIRFARKNKQVVSIGYHGNVVSLWERLVEELHNTGELLVDLGSDQTSCHCPYDGGYYPVQLGYEEAKEMLYADPDRFKSLVQESLVRQVAAVNKLAEKGMFFWDYGNAFLLEAKRAGADVGVKDDDTGLKFRYPSYVQDIMGNIFSLGFGPFRWVCTSGLPEDLEKTDNIAIQVFEKILEEDVPPVVGAQYRDNLLWIREAGKHGLVNGSIKAPIVISRDHHDVSGTDSPYRETSNIEDGSAFTADMAVQNCIGDSFRGATWVALHNGGGVGWGEVVNGGFGLLLDGSEDAAGRADLMLSWDVSNGVARRCWSGNRNALLATEKAMEDDPLLRVTIPHQVEDTNLLENLFQ
ncbi:hypothetical protein L9F63_021628 [Diploptera punctata]|uniref:Urocanate hydratase n=1 Tax=Diploptera punctata TaxID=6984 RepID=A0AAD8EBQ9_DIPPU|nr:hypothetical protein L9F63_021628 [Diploptera punctata]